MRNDRNSNSNGNSNGNSNSTSAMGPGLNGPNGSLPGIGLNGLNGLNGPNGPFHPPGLNAEGNKNHFTTVPKQPSSRVSSPRTIRSRASSNSAAAEDNSSSGNPVRYSIRYIFLY